MTKGSSENPQGGSGKKPSKSNVSKDEQDAARGGKPARKVAKTMLEANIPQFEEEPAPESIKKEATTGIEGTQKQPEPERKATNDNILKGTKEQEEPPKKGTKENVSDPEPVKKGTKENAPKRVAKTMLERPVVDPASLGIPAQAASGAAPAPEREPEPAKDEQPAAPTVPPSAVRPARNRQVPRTMLENPVSSFDRFMQGEDLEGEPVEEPLTAPVEQAPSAPPQEEVPAPSATDSGAPGQTNRKVARTMLENPVTSFDKYMQGAGDSAAQPEPEPVAEPPVEQTPPAAPTAQVPSPRPAPPAEGEGKGARRVAKTILEQPAGNFDKYMPAAEPARLEPQTPSAADIARIDSVEIPVQKSETLRAEPEEPTAADIARIDSVEIPVQKAPAGRAEAQENKKGTSEKTRRPKRTLMENEVPTFVLERLHEEAPKATGSSKKKTTTQRRVYKTLMENEIADFESEVLGYVQPMEGLTTDAPPMQEPKKFVARTMLDMNVLAVAVAKHEKKMEEKSIQMAKAKALEPQKPFIKIDNYKLAMSCGYRWDGAEPKERYRACGTCNTWLYNFEGLELPEAEALIYKCQNLKNAPLYKRADGKFMTTDCPVEVKRKQDHIMFVIAGTLAVIAIVVVIMLIPKPPPPPPKPPAEADDVPKKKVHRKIVPVKLPDGSVHFELKKDDDDKSGAGSSSSSSSSSTAAPPAQPQTIQPIPMVPAPTPQQAPADQVWQYANPNDAQIQTNH